MVLIFTIHRNIIPEFSHSAKERQGSEEHESAVKEDMLEDEESRMNGHSAVEVLRRENRALRQQASMYRVTQKVSDLGWVDLDLEYSIILLEQ